MDGSDLGPRLTTAGSEGHAAPADAPGATARGGLATAMPRDRPVRIAALGDLHYTKSSQGAMNEVLAEAARHADVLVLCGDLTDHGLPDEAMVLSRELSTARVPIIAVLGNHDYEADRATDVAEILGGVGVTILDGESCMLHGVGFAGVKGFGGGFDRRMLQAWGEHAVKGFVQAGIDEALKLEGAMAKLRSERRVVVLHYAPVASTSDGEPPEIYPFLGSSRLEEPINRYRADAVLHGHAHRGTPEGRTSAGVPVYNVALPLLRRTQPGQPPVRIIEISAVQQRRED